MRVTGGRLLGRRLRTTRGRVVRPTADPVREALFQIIAPRLAGARVLDLFAGSGALGIESLSRGAESCVFVEKRREVATVLERNLRELELLDQGRVVVGTAERQVRVLGRARGAAFDLILLDPPYDYAGSVDLLAELPPLLVAGGRLVWEHHRVGPTPPPVWEVVDERSYGQTRITIMAAG